jgi:hypothetical protein
MPIYRLNLPIVMNCWGPRAILARKRAAHKRLSHVTILASLTVGREEMPRLQGVDPSRSPRRIMRPSETLESGFLQVDTHRSRKQRRGWRAVLRTYFRHSRGLLEHFAKQTLCELSSTLNLINGLHRHLLCVSSYIISF